MNICHLFIKSTNLRNSFLILMEYLFHIISELCFNNKLIKIRVIDNYSDKFRSSI